MLAAVFLQFYSRASAVFVSPATYAGELWRTSPIIAGFFSIHIKVVRFDATTLWHLDASEWVPSTASEADAASSRSHVRFTPKRTNSAAAFHQARDVSESM